MWSGGKMASKRSQTLDLVVYLVIRAVVCVIHAVPPVIAFWLSDRIAWLLYRYVPSRRRVALENLHASFPELDTQRGEELVQAMYRHLIRAVFEVLLLTRKLHLTNWRAFVDLYPAVGLPATLFSSRPALIVTGHFGNWEMAGYLLGRLSFKTYAIARILDNPHLERFVKRLRQATGQTIIAKHDDFDRLTSVLTNGGKVSTLADQDAGPRGVFVNFFGRPASTHKAIALMAIEFDALIVATGVPRVSRSNRATGVPLPGMESTFYAVEVEEIIDPREYATDPDAVKAITQRYTSALERLIRRHPEQYFWLHRRWKHQPVARKKKQAA
jgi:KDO2-lipid IV(A) lauroyltransferase